MATIRLEPIVPKTIAFWISGTSPLIQHAWSQKALGQLRMTAAERKKQPKVSRNPEAEAIGATYWYEDEVPGLPALAFKASIVSAAHKDLGIERTLVRKSIFLPAAYYKNMITPLAYDSMEIREDIVRVGAGQTDLRYRPEFTGWRAQFYLQLEPSLINEQDLVNLINRAGFSIGIGEWRPEKGGDYGRFEFDTAEAIREVPPTPIKEVKAKAKRVA